jgi:D-proline reductase (dithiol) PrdB
MGADAVIRDRVGDIPAPTFDTVAATSAPPLSEATVAIVTTAGLKPSGEATLWRTTDSSFTVIDSTDRDVQLSHFSPNFDRSGFAQDLNVVYPIDRLAELVERGEIGSLGPRNLSFMGAQSDATFSTIIHDTGPRAAQVLLDDEVDVVLLTPV